TGQRGNDAPLELPDKGQKRSDGLNIVAAAGGRAPVGESHEVAVEVAASDIVRRARPLARCRAAPEAAHKRLAPRWTGFFRCGVSGRASASGGSCPPAESPRYPDAGTGTASWRAPG